MGKSKKQPNALGKSLAKDSSKRTFTKSKVRKKKKKFLFLFFSQRKGHVSFPLSLLDPTPTQKGMTGVAECTGR